VPLVAATPTGGNGFIKYQVAAAENGVSVKTVKRWVKDGPIETLGVGAGRKVSRASLGAFLTSRRMVVKTPSIFEQGLSDEQNRKVLLEFLRPLVDALVTERLANRNNRAQRGTEVAA
jgi:hypothetical protein